MCQERYKMCQLDKDQEIVLPNDTGHRNPLH